MSICCIEGYSEITDKTRFIQTIEEESHAGFIIRWTEDPHRARIWSTEREANQYVIRLNSTYIQTSFRIVGMDEIRAKEVIDS
jgi:hypothetical protein